MKTNTSNHPASWNTRQQLLTLIASALACCSAGVAAEDTPFDATPDDNTAVAATQGALMATHVGGTIGGVAVQGPAGIGFEISAIAADNALKHTPPTLTLPGDFSVFPNAISTRNANPFACVYRFQESIRSGEDIEGDDFRGGVEEGFASVLYVPFDPLDDVFADLGKPTVYHPQADIRVRAINPFLGSVVNSGLPDSDSLQLQRRPEFPAGRHAIQWEANTSTNLVLDFTLPSLLVPLGIGAEHYVAKRAAAKSAARFIPDIVGVAADAGLIAVDVTGAAASTQWYEDTLFFTSANRGTQTLTVWDQSLPYFRDTGTGATNVTEQAIELEATDFNGVRLGRVVQSLRDRFEAIDNCGEEFTIETDSPNSRLFTIDGGAQDLVWAAREVDGGPYNPNVTDTPTQMREGDNLVTFLTQRISVVDTSAPLLLPPPSFASERTSDWDLTAETFPLGRPRVADLADPAPQVSSNAPATLEVGPVGVRYEVVWEATDNQGNTTTDDTEHPEAFTQIVTLKPPGINTAPTALPASASAVASNAVEILLTGTDTEEPMIGGPGVAERYDPLAFEIATYPEAGQFEAPLLPFFVDDFRLTPAGEREEGDNTTRISPLKDLADPFRLLDVVDRGAFLNTEICEAAPGSENDIEFGGVIPVDFVYRPSLVYVDDQNFYYLRDHFWVCGEGTNGDRNAEPVLSKLPRLSKWTDDGELVAMRSLYPTQDPAYSNDNLDPDFWPSNRFSYQNDRVWIELDNDDFIDGGIGEPVVRDYISFSNNLSDDRPHGRTVFEAGVVSSFLLGAAADTSRELLYEMFSDPLPRSNTRRRQALITVSRYSDDMDVGDTRQDIGTFLLGGRATVNGNDLTVDSDGNVYIADNTNHRIHKIAPTKLNEAGEWVLGEYIGWMGRCSENLLNEEDVPFSACDEVNEVSFGYACDDIKCLGFTSVFGGGGIPPAALTGDQPGQFNGPRSIAIGPGDILYVADTGNSRVQRFGPDGTFAGEVKSTGTGVNQGDAPEFIIGNMGEPEQVAVNATSFYVMEAAAANGDFFVHSFKTTPFYDITHNADNSTAKIKYVSNFDFLPNDSFSFVVDDGIAQSNAAVVNVDVTRAFTPPERLRAQCFADFTLDIDIPCTLDEDNFIYLRLSAFDADGFVSTGGNDTLSFSIDTDPSGGQLQLVDSTDNAGVYRYVPNRDFNGTDAFRFRAFDGRDFSADDARVELNVTPMPDTVSIEFDDDLRAARGFASIISAEFSDVDEDPDLQASLVSLDWGDGVVASAPSWIGSGREDLNGREISLQADYGRGQGMLLGSHDYASTGTYTITAIMDAAPEENLPATQVSASVTVLDVTVVGVAQTLPDSSVTPDTPFPLTLTVENFEPSTGTGLTADNVEIAFDVPEGLSVSVSDQRCSGAGRVTCNLGNLAPGATTDVVLAGTISLAAARQRASYELVIEIVDDGPKLSDRNVASFTVDIDDRDGDGTIDADDAFVDDARWQADTDGDGLADRWERDNGFNPNVADDVTADSDGDGYTLLEEFQNGSFPNLNESEGIERANRLESPDNILEDRFGLAMAGGDLNLDGYADIVIAANRYDTEGAAFVAYGSADGINPTLSLLDAPADASQFGVAIAVGDWDDNDYPDIAIAASSSVFIYFNSGAILDQPDQVLVPESLFSTSNIRLLSGDLDNDGMDDLLVSADAGGAVTRLEFYLSSLGGLDTPPQTSTLSSIGLSALAIGDIDGDGANDLLLGNSGDETVAAYLGAANDWLTATGLTDERVIASPLNQANFGFAIASGDDVTGDGIDDLVVGSPAQGGFVNLYNSESLYWTDSNAAPLQIIAGEPVSTPGNGTHGDQLGASVAIDHLDTDRFADVVAGGNRAGPNDEGQVRIWRGSPSGLVDERIESGTTPFDLLGHFVLIPGDVDGNGIADFVGGASDVQTTQNANPDGGYVEFFYHSFDAATSAMDSDNDGVDDGVDNCPVDANTNQADLDGDDIGDACDVDIDGDGLENNADNCPTDASLDQTDTDGDLDGDVCDADDDNDGTADVDDAFPLNPDYTADSDGDGMPDAYEQDNGLNPNDATDADGDLDGDGRSNREEFEQGTDIAADDVPPQLTVPADIVVTAIGPLTPVDLGTASATDVRDGALTTQSDSAGPFRSGRTVVTWDTADTAGNTATDTQRVDVIPLVGFVGNTLLAAEGQQTQIRVALSGDAVQYPVTVPYTVAGTASAGSDYTLSTGDVVIDETNTGAIALTVLADGQIELEETLLLSLGAPENAVIGFASDFEVRIFDGNRAPLPRISIEQGMRQQTTVTQDGGVVSVVVDPADPNAMDTHSFDWSATDNALVPMEGFGSATFTFDPAMVTTGVYRLEVNVTDDSILPASATQYRYVRVIASAPSFQPGADSDGDDVADTEETLRDTNENGVSDYLDPISVSHQLVARTSSDSLLQTAAGYTLTLGRVALASGDDAMVGMMDIADFGNAGGPASAADDSRYSYPGGVFDFEVSALPEPGDVVTVVIPQSAAIPADAIYRKYVANQGWSDFVSDQSNSIASAAGTAGICPAPGSADYQPGLTQGHFCVQLSLQDGGPNDADGLANRVVRDPGGVAAVAGAAQVEARQIAVSDQSVSTGDTNVVMMRFELISNSSDVVMNSLSLQASGSGNDAVDIRSVALWVDTDANGSIDAGDNSIGSGTYSVDNGALTLQMNTPFTLDAGTTAFIVSYDF